MKFVSILIIALILPLILVSLGEVYAQDDLSITECESRCGTRTDMGQVIGNYQAIAACRSRCASQYWNKTEKKDKKKKDSLFDD